jgi:membrane protein implicated in regulation of membrane protease activity
MISLYLGCLALGGLLIVASIVMGGKDFDKDFDKGIDLDATGEAAAGDAVGEAAPAEGGPVEKGGGDSWLPFLSLRFWTFALATFGAAGSILSLAGFSDLVAAPSSALTGFGVGYAVAWAFRRLSREKVSGDYGLRQVAGREGRLLLAVGPERTGKVRVQIDGQDVDLLATTQDEKVLNLREKVLIIRVQDGIAEVTSVQPERRRLE